MLADSLAAGSNAPRVSIVGNVSRDLFRTGAAKPDNESLPDHYPLYVCEYFRRLRVCNADLIIHDRTLVDVLAYVEINGNASLSFREMLEELVHVYIRGIDRYFYTPIQFPIVHDSVRSTDAGYQSEIDRKIIEILNCLAPQYVTLRGSPDERLRTAVQQIEPFGL